MRRRAEGLSFDGVAFTIPMRGNEFSDAPNAIADHCAMFTIPMRGNEVMYSGRPFIPSSMRLRSP